MPKELIRSSKRHVIQFEPVAKQFKDLAESGQYLMVRYYRDEPTRIVIDYVGDRWARGHSYVIDVSGEKQNIPYTISFADVISGMVKVDTE